MNRKSSRLSPEARIERREAILADRIATHELHQSGQVRRPVARVKRLNRS